MGGLMVYLITNPPARDQYRSPRRKRPTGLTVLHTAESVMDTVGPDTGAENVAAFIARRTAAGSYHDLVDSDSAIQLVRYGDEAYQDATGSNAYALSISWALSTTDWPRLTPERRAAFLAQGARAFARQQAWLAANRYPQTQIRRVTKAQSDAGTSGFIAHGDRDPARRTDPGKTFPWPEWLAACRAATTSTTTTTTKDWIAMATQQDLDRAVAGLLGVEVGRTGLSVGVILDRLYGSAARDRTQVAALTAAVQALAIDRSLDPAAVQAAIDAAVKAALADVQITLTNKGA